LRRAAWGTTISFVRDALSSLAAAAERPAGLDALFEAAVPALRRLAGFDGLCALSLDPETLLATGHVDLHGIPEEGGMRLMELEYSGGEVLSFGDLAAAGRPACDLHAETGGRPWDSPRWEEVLEPCDRPHEARVVLADGTGVWGGLCLFRDAAGRPFSPVELAGLTAAAPVLAGGVRRAVLAAALRAGQESAPGVLLFDGDGQLQGASGAADRWLGDLPGDTNSIRLEIAGLVRRVLAAGPGSAPQRTSLPVDGQGWATLHGDRLGDAVIVVIEPARGAGVLAVLARAYGFTARERDVVALVLAGTSTKAMSARLGLSQWTVQDHLKSVFEKTATRTRGELSARLLGTRS
jgi:DNA-binding CsgD family transcriptional regulator